MKKEVNKVLNEVFGFSELKKVAGRDSFKSIKKRDVLAIIEAGSGKSLCYYVPAMLSEGLTLFVYSLIFCGIF